MERLDLLWEQVVRYFGEERRRIAHARRVLRSATWILEVDNADRETVQAAAMVHDIGILEAVRKHGSTAGPYQELEGPPIARNLMEQVGFADGVIEHVCRIVASHHSPGEVDTPEFDVLWDADWLVNIPDELPGLNTGKLERLIKQVFRTSLGRLLAERLLLRRTTPAPMLVSGCLAGQKCRYDASDCLVEGIKVSVVNGEAVPVCPERLGGLSAPRCPAEVVGGDGGDVLDGKARVIDRHGTDVTAPFVAGASEALELAKSLGIRNAILKESSPSCGSGNICDGSFTGVKVPGEGVLTVLLRRHGIKVISESEVISGSSMGGESQ